MCLITLWRSFHRILFSGSHSPVAFIGCDIDQQGLLRQKHRVDSSDRDEEYKQLPRIDPHTFRTGRADVEPWLCCIYST